MRILLKERLKDIIIDHVYHYCFNEKIKKLEGDNINLNIDVEADINDDPVTKSAYEQILKSKEKLNFRFETRNTIYCSIIEGNAVHKSFMERLLAQGFVKSDKLASQIEDSVTELVHKSYLTRNQPISNELSLTQKGINHYNTGLSFERLFTEGRIARTALIVSIISIILSIVAFLFNLRNNDVT